MPTFSHEQRAKALRPTIDKRIADYVDAAAAAAADSAMMVALKRITALDHEVTSLEVQLATQAQAITLLQKQVQSLTDIAAKQASAERPLTRAQMVKQNKANSA